MVTIVPISIEHAKGYNRVLDGVARERKYLALLEGPPLARTLEFVTRNIAKGYPQFVALADGDVVGWCDITPDSRPVHAHVGTLGMGLLPPFRGRGNGAALIERALRAHRCGMVRVELSVYSDNRPAIALYESFGFRTEAVMKDAACIDGHYKDVVLMAVVDRANALQTPGGA
jgi:RimJ/RimL family protein N-acetyltransferase